MDGLNLNLKEQLLNFILANLGPNTVSAYVVDLVSGRYERIMLAKQYTAVVQSTGMYDKMLDAFAVNSKADSEQAQCVHEKLKLNALRRYSYSQPLVEECPYIFKGKVYWARISYRPLLTDEDGHVQQLLMVQTDITQQIVVERRNKFASEVLQKNYHTILSIDLDHNRYVRIKSDYVGDTVLTADVGLLSDNIHTFSEKIIHPFCKDEYERFLNADNLREALDEDSFNLAFNYRRKVDGDEYRWCRVEIEPLEGYGVEHHRVLAYMSNITDARARQEADEHAINSLSSIYFVVYDINLATDTFEVVKAPGRSAKEQGTMAGTSARDSLNKAVETYVMPDSKSLMYRFLNVDTLEERLGSKNSISVEYVRKNVGWCRGTFIPLEWDDMGNLEHVLYAITNIDEEKRMSLALLNVQRQQRMNMALGNEANYRVEHDALTGMLNRVGLERLLVALASVNNPVTVLLVNVDGMEEINNTYGDSMGDQVLIHTAHVLQSVFRSNDFIARLEQDDFCVVLNNVDKSKQHLVETKVREVNQILMKSSKSLPPVTISAGGAFGSKGYTQALYSLADKALKEVKNSHSKNTHVAFKEATAVSARVAVSDSKNGELLKSAFTGMWCIEETAEGKRTLYADAAMKRMLCFNDELTPEQCYTYWALGVDSSYVQAIEEFINKIYECGQAEIVYFWHHPIYGKIKVRVGGSYDADCAQGRRFYGYLHDITNVHNASISNNNEAMLEALHGIFHTIYLTDLEQGSYAAFKGLRDEQPLINCAGKLENLIQEFVTQLVAPVSRDAVLDFVDIKTLDERMADVDKIHCVYMSATLKCWCRAVILAAERNGEGKLKKVVLLTYSVDEDQRNSIEKDQIIHGLADRYRFICRFELQHDNFYAIANEPKMAELVAQEKSAYSCFHKLINQYTHPTYRESMRKFMDFSTLPERLASAGSLSMDFRDPEYGWCVLEVAAAERNELQQATAALLTVRVVQNEHRRDKGSKETDFDPMTGIRTRKSFMQEADRRRSDTSPLAFLIVDIDYYKELQEKYDPATCDALLVKLATKLRQDAPDGSTGCHFEADRFAVMVKNCDLQRIDELTAWLDLVGEYMQDEHDGLPAVTFSVGIAFSQKGYQDDVYRHADEALMQMKRNGSTGYRVYNDSVEHNPHLSFQDWSKLRSDNRALLNILETQLSDFSFFNIIDFNEDSYHFLITSELPALRIPSVGSYSEMIEYYKEEFYADNEETQPLNVFCKRGRTQMRYENGRDHVSFVCKHKGSDAWRKIKQVVLERRGSLITKMVVGWRDISKENWFDSLTGSLNLEGFLRSIKTQLESEERSEYDILYFNIREFKNINKQMGFNFGNSLLCRFADTLKLSSLQPVAVARDSADRFYCLVLKQNINLYQLGDLCKLEFPYGGQTIRARLNCGIYRVEADEYDLRAMCDKAKSATTSIKNEFAKPYAFYDPDMSTHQQKKVEVINDVDAALAAGEFHIYYQPVFDAKTLKVVSAESLIRWQVPGKGMVSPGEFIPALEENGYISLLDMFVFNGVKSLLERRKLAGMHIVPIAINLSRMDLLNEDMLYQLIHLTEDTALEHKYLRFEITESSYVDISKAGKEFMERMQELGTSLAADDFGVGYSSFGTLVDQKFDIIKLDMSYVKQIGTNDKAESVIRNVINMAHDMGSKVVAEGVETEAQLKFLADHDCDYIQGYLLSRPLPEEAFVKLLN